ncbi:hypothetical protein RUM44_001884 [Polyplax serrata]|uniref:Uncharacterized protein n=1 Tax=Polyplax serrata TaxID=468196 RepID=A0ABR1ALA5_POLSC
MMKYIVTVYLCATAVTFCLAAAIGEVPKECVMGSETYNETLCAETCKKEEYRGMAYCANFTTAAPTTAATAAETEKMVKTEVQATENATTSAPSSTTIHPSSGMYLKSSIVFTFLSCLFIYIVS